MEEYARLYQEEYERQLAAGITEPDMSDFINKNGEDVDEYVPDLSKSFENLSEEEILYVKNNCKQYPFGVCEKINIEECIGCECNRENTVFDNE